MVDNNKLVNLGGRDFMRLHPVVSLQQAAPGGGVRHIKGDAAQSVASVGSASRVLYANIEGLTRYMGMPLVHTAMSRKPVKMVLGGAVGVPIFHLPYNNDQNFRVTLVDRQGIGNVNFFITEFVDGCSVYIEGAPTGPTAYHINAMSTQRRTKWTQFYWSDARKRQADWRSKYDKMDQRFKTEGTFVKSVQNAAVGALPQAAKLENHDYMGDLGLSLATLQLNQHAPQIMNGQSVDGFELMAQQGTVFGERNPHNGNWKFYIQRRAFLRYLHLPANAAPAQLGFQWVVHSVEQFWPTSKTGRAVP